MTQEIIKEIELIKKDISTMKQVQDKLWLETSMAKVTLDKAIFIMEDYLAKLEYQA